MKTNSLKFLLLFILSSVTFSCVQDEDSQAINPNQRVNLKFETDESLNIENNILLIENVQVFGGKLISDQLQAVNVIHSITGKKLTAYTIKQNIALNGRITKMEVTRGYVFAGRCLEYGTLVTDTNSGVQMFFPADIQTKVLGFADICPPANSEWS